MRANLSSVAANINSVVDWSDTGLVWTYGIFSHIRNTTMPALDMLLQRIVALEEKLRLLDLVLFGEEGLDGVLHGTAEPEEEGRPVRGAGLAE